MQPIETEQPAEPQLQPLKATDRCDVCGAQAYIKVSLANGELLFCAHHGKANKAKLESIAISWQDESDKLLSR